MREFVDCETELWLMEEEWAGPDGRFIILYGRRRIRKTRLISEFIRGKQGISCFAEDTSRDSPMGGR